VVFCRNVLIYFDQVTKGQVLARVAQIMPADGYLYLGGAETVLGISDSFEVVPGQRGVYRLSSGSGGTVSLKAG
jgi:chemotaxis protein methyltransferase CheR